MCARDAPIVQLVVCCRAHLAVRGRDATTLSFCQIISISPHISKSSKSSVRVDIVTPRRLLNKLSSIGSFERIIRKWIILVQPIFKAKQNVVPVISKYYSSSGTICFTKLCSSQTSCETSMDVIPFYVETNFLIQTLTKIRV